MINHILAIRNSVHILNTASTIIQIRKALNSLFHRVHYRGTLLIYAQAYKALKINHEAVFTFVTSWLPGLISNYKQMVSTLSYNRKFMSLYGSTFFKRPQLDALNASITKPVLKISKIIYPRRPARIASVPTISFSVLDDFIWLNECHNLGIPSIQICDTQSRYDLITYPIISNQRSVPFTYLLTHLFSETCNFAVLLEHLYFIPYYKHLGIVTRFKKNVKLRIKIARQRPKRYRTRHHNIMDNFGKLYFNETDHLTQDFLNKALSKLKYQYSKAPLRHIISKHTYLINKRNFCYKIRDYLKVNKFNLSISTPLLIVWEIIRRYLLKVLKALQKLDDFYYNLRRRISYFRFKPYKKISRMVRTLLKRAYVFLLRPKRNLRFIVLKRKHLKCQGIFYFYKSLLDSKIDFKVITPKVKLKSIIRIY